MIINKILIVDDDELYRGTLTGFIRKKGYTVIEASSGNEAFELVHNQKPGEPLITGIITDLRMPNGTGIELMKKIRKFSDEILQIPKIIVNTGMLEGGEKYLTSLGARHIFIKPVDLKAMAEALASITSQPN